MTRTWLEWFHMKDDPESRMYDFAQRRPVWKAWWFRGSVVAVCGCIIWFFWPGLM